MRNHSAILLLVILWAGAELANGGDITGQVTLRGTPRPEVTVDLSPDANCVALHKQPLKTRHYLVDSNGGLANVLVYIKSGLERKRYPVPTESVLLDQTNCLYEPYVMGVMVNQKIRIRNSDPTLHNVHATPKPGGGNREFNFTQPIQGMETEKSFPAVEIPIRFKCDVHPWMFAYVAVFDHPFYAVTAKDGTYTIQNVPKGKYVLEAFHEKTHRQKSGVTREVTVDGDARADFVVELP